MKIMILGTGKSGTTALVYKMAAGLPNCQAFSGGRPGKYIGDYENAVYKHTYERSKGKDFELYREHLKKEQYDNYDIMKEAVYQTIAERIKAPVEDLVYVSHHHLDERDYVIISVWKGKRNQKYTNVQGKSWDRLGSISRLSHR